MPRRRFLLNFLRNPKHVGAVWPSSSRLATVMVQAAKVCDSGVIIEFGPGTGVFTEHIAHEAPDGATFFSIELNPEFVALTRARCPNVPVLEGSALDAPQFLQQMGHTQCDCIVSGLPWASFDEGLQDNLLDVVQKVLKPGGRFVTFTYLQSCLLSSGRRFRNKLERRFDHVKTTSVVWRNMPPAYAYTAEQTK